MEFLRNPKQISEGISGILSEEIPRKILDETFWETLGGTQKKMVENPGGSFFKIIAVKFLGNISENVSVPVEKNSRGFGISERINEDILLELLQKIST